MSTFQMSDRLFGNNLQWPIRIFSRIRSSSYKHSALRYSIHIEILVNVISTFFFLNLTACEFEKNFFDNKKKGYCYGVLMVLCTLCRNSRASKIFQTKANKMEYLLVSIRVHRNFCCRVVFGKFRNRSTQSLYHVYKTKTR